MDSGYKKRISASRRLLQNPYAHIEDLEPPSEERELASEARGLVRTSRLKLANRYAHLNGEGGFDAADAEPDQNNHWDIRGSLFYEPRKKDGRYSYAELERRAADLRRWVWDNRRRIWPEGVPDNPVDMLDPAKIIPALGYTYSEVEGLVEATPGHGSHEVAAAISANPKSVWVSRQFRAEIRRYTAAHEIGHAVLHSFGSSAMHRDKPTDGSSPPSDSREKEAERFAGFFLLPEKLVRHYFSHRFGEGVFVLNDDSCFLLFGCSLQDMEVKLASQRDLSKALALASSYGEKSFCSLASEFKVSASAMAIRLEQLGLVRW